MEDSNGIAVPALSPRRNQSIDRPKLFEQMLLKEMPGTSRTNEPMHAVLESELGDSVMVGEGREAQNVRNHALIHYLATLATSNHTNDTFDFDFVESLLSNGADINSTDKTGQTVFHEVARSWNIDVATFLLKNGGNINQQDQYGRSPLHVAAAVDYAEMVEFLLQNGADIDSKTSGEGQAPVHFAAKNDAVNTLQMLLGFGANIDARDSKNRTPLQVAAEMNRSKAAKLLIAEGAPAGVYDNLGNSALSLLIEKIPEVALSAMDQFHSVDTINRKEFYFLNYLEGTKLKEKKTPARTPLEIAVQNDRFDIVMHPIMQRLIGVKWQIYGKTGAVFDLVLNLVYSVLWTVLAVTLPTYGRDLYLPLAVNSWRIIIGILLILFTILEIRKQIVNTMKTRKELKNWREWRAGELEQDLAYCHPRWPQEAQYLRAEIKAVRNLSLILHSDWWIYFDWAALVLILATIASHVTYFHYSTDLSNKVHHYIIIPLLLILWFRIFKYARPFEGAGPFVVIFGSVLGDIVKWGFLNLIIVIPFTCAFWITFGAISLNPVEGYDTVGPLMYNMFSMMVVNSHQYSDLEEANPIMARLLCGSFIGIAAIITLNLLIALLSNTFERLYENAVANAVMQRARTILLLQKSLRRKQKKKYYDFIRTDGSPEVIVKTLGRLLTMDCDDHGTIEDVREDVKMIVNILGEKFGRKFKRGKKSDLDFVKMDVTKVRRSQEELLVEVKNMKHSLGEMTDKVEEMLRNNNNNTNNSNNTNNNNDNNNNNEDENNTNTNNKSFGKQNKSVHKMSDTGPSPEDETETGSSETDFHDIPKKSTKDSKIVKRRRPHLDQESKEDTTKKQRITHQQRAHAPKTSSHKPSHGYLNPFGKPSYPGDYQAEMKENYDPQNQRYEIIDTYDQTEAPPSNEQWFARSFDRRSQSQSHRRSMGDFDMQQKRDFGQRYDQEQFPPNFSQRSSSHSMRQPTLDKRPSKPPDYPSQVQNMTSLRSTPNPRQPNARNRSKEPPTMQNAQDIYGFQNYGFQPIDEDANELIPSRYDRQPMLRNPREPQHLPMTSQVLSPGFQQHGIPEYRPEHRPRVQSNAETYRDQQFLPMQNGQNIYGHQDYDFQTIDQDLNRLTPRGYEERQSFQNRNGQRRNMTRPISSEFRQHDIQQRAIHQPQSVPRNTMSSQYAPLTTHAPSSEFQQHDIHQPQSVSRDTMESQYAPVTIQAPISEFQQHGFQQPQSVQRNTMASHDTPMTAQAPSSEFQQHGFQQPQSMERNTMASHDTPLTAQAPSSEFLQYGSQQPSSVQRNTMASHDTLVTAQVPSSEFQQHGFQQPQSTLQLNTMASHDTPMTAQAPSSEIQQHDIHQPQSVSRNTMSSQHTPMTTPGPSSKFQQHGIQQPPTVQTSIPSAPRELPQPNTAVQASTVSAGEKLAPHVEVPSAVVAHQERKHPRSHQRPVVAESRPDNKTMVSPNVTEDDDETSLESKDSDEGADSELPELLSHPNTEDDQTKAVRIKTDPVQDLGSV